MIIIEPLSEIKFNHSSINVVGQVSCSDTTYRSYITEAKPSYITLSGIKDESKPSQLL